MLSPQPIKIAVIGGGLIGPRHAQSIIKSPSTILIAIVDPAPHGASIAASLSTAYYPSIALLLASPHRPDAAIICTPNSTHVALSTELANAGIHILVEKPISTTIDSGRKLIATCAASNVHLLVGHHRRFNPYIISTKSLLSSGSLGRILAISGLWTTSKPPSYYNPPTAWRRDASAGVVLINLVHEIDLMHHLFGPIVRVHGEAAVPTRGFDASEGGAVILKFASGVVGTFIVSDATPSPFNFEAGTGENPTIPKAGKDFYRIFGTKGTLSVGDMVRYSYEKGEGSEDGSWTDVLSEEKISVHHTVPFDAQIEHFVKVIRGEQAPMCTGAEGLRALVVCEAVERVLRTGGVVDVE